MQSLFANVAVLHIHTLLPGIIVVALASAVQSVEQALAIVVRAV